MTKIRFRRDGSACVGPECTREALFYPGVCRGHYHQLRRGRTLVALSPQISPTLGRPGVLRHTIGKEGYRYVSFSYFDRTTETVRRFVTPEHRLEMERHLGRPLASFECVHHRNGTRDDNRIENLELVHLASHHPGQKVSDLHAEIRRLRDRIPFACAGDDLRLVA